MLRFLNRLFSGSNNSSSDDATSRFLNRPALSTEDILGQVDVDKLIEDYLRATPAERENIIESFDNTLAWGLLLKSKDLAVDAVKQNDYDLVKKGIILHSIENARSDWRDNLVRLSLLYNSGKKLNQDPDVLFVEIANISQPTMKDLLINFTRRSETEKSIKVMGYMETHSPNFDYQSVSW